ncbi:SafA/ExsA family spore coat assembly protein [Virgibacillus senegalensis]|uniref:SafA/ExsA family spore coat assembly protein n=1 Tax=Virgibacillus senegalensis TaxID=1499679 RepID=UPI00069CFE63|nr:SafA/ExsA family spore coat assembly protein [Virgibacillus senegalensis]
MRIHVVQKGETLWEIAKKYGVDFEELKQVNSHLSNPDMIMPGMKIKIPGSSVQVKQEGSLDKEMQQYPPQTAQQKQKKKEMETQPKPKEKEKPETKPMAGKQPAKHSWKDTSPKSFPVIKEDDHKKPASKMMEVPKVPMMEQHMEKFPINMTVPKVPHYEKPKKKEDKKWEHEKKHHEMPSQTLPAYQPMPMHYYQPISYCIPMQPMTLPAHYYPMGETVPCGPQFGVENMTMNQYSYPAVQGVSQEMEDLMESSSSSSSSSMEMPHMPHHVAGMHQDDCGCGGSHLLGEYADPAHSMAGYPEQQWPGYGYPGAVPQQGMQPFGGQMLMPQQMYPTYNQPSYYQQYQPQQPFSGMANFNPPYPQYSREEEEESE